MIKYCYLVTEFDIVHQSGVDSSLHHCHIKFVLEYDCSPREVRLFCEEQLHDHEELTLFLFLEIVLPRSNININHIGTRISRHRTHDRSLKELKSSPAGPPTHHVKNRDRWREREKTERERER